MKCICPICEKAGYNTHNLDMHQTRKFNPTVRADQIEPERVSDRAEDLADGRRANIANHRHVAIGKLRDNY